MRMGLAIDAACDLSQAFLEQHDIAVMPITVKIDRETFMDDRKPSELQRFIDRRLGSRSHSAETEPCPVEEISHRPAITSTATARPVTRLTVLARE